MPSLVDTSVAIDHLRGFEPAVDLLVSLVQDEAAILASELVRFELLVGARSSELPDLDAFCEILVWVPVTEQIARVGAGLARRFRHSHSGIGEVDYLIAATALALGADLLTTNVRHFPMFAGLAAPYPSAGPAEPLKQ